MSQVLSFLNDSYPAPKCGEPAAMDFPQSSQMQTSIDNMQQFVRGYEFQLLTEEEKEESLAVFLHSLEQDLYMHTVNLQRYEGILDEGLVFPGFQERILQLRNETVSRLVEVSSIIKHTLPQLPSVDATKEAYERFKARMAK